jgi:RNA polymerase sigma-70 factor, ECF subfamily
MTGKNSPGGSIRPETEERLAILMRQSQDGDRAAYQRLLTEVRDVLKPFVRNSFMRLGMPPDNGLDDVLQEVLLGIHGKRATYNPGQKFMPWMYAIARYKIIDFLRRTHRERKRFVTLEGELEIAELFSDFDAGGTGASGAKRDAEVMLSELPDKQRTVLRLVKLEGLSVSEAARRTGYSESDIKITTHRAIKVLRDKFKGVGR